MSEFRLQPIGRARQIDTSDPARKPPARAQWAHLWLHEAVTLEAIAIRTGVAFADVQRTVRRQLSSGPLPAIRRAA